MAQWENVLSLIVFIAVAAAAAVFIGPIIYKAIENHLGKLNFAGWASVGDIFMFLTVGFMIYTTSELIYSEGRRISMRRKIMRVLVFIVAPSLIAFILIMYYFYLSWLLVVMLLTGFSMIAIGLIYELDDYVKHQGQQGEVKHE